MPQSKKIGQQMKVAWSPSRGASRGGHGGLRGRPFSAQSLWLAGGRKLFLQGSGRPIHAQSLGPAGRALGKSRRRCRRCAICGNASLPSGRSGGEGGEKLCRSLAWRRKRTCRRMKTMSVKGGVYDHEAYEAKTILWEYMGPTSFYTYIYYYSIDPIDARVTRHTMPRVTCRKTRIGTLRAENEVERAAQRPAPNPGDESACEEWRRVAASDRHLPGPQVPSLYHGAIKGD
jgi:hypothetical protein